MGWLESLFGGDKTEQYNTRLANNWAQGQSEKDRKWQEHMSNTAIQRRKADLKAAGVNPILGLVDSSGASSPGGSTAQTLKANTMANNGSPVDTAMAWKTIENLTAEKEQITASKNKTEAEKKGIELNNELIEKTMPDIIKSTKSNARAEKIKNDNQANIYGSKRGQLLQWLTESGNPMRGIVGGSVSAGTSTVTKK